jgi:ParB-like chromosome segregation protein Spo0J
MTPCRDLKIELVAIERLKLDLRNPRLHSDRQVKQIARSIESFGFNVPVLVDGNNNLLAGHGRVEAALKRGLREIPVIRSSI